MSAPRAQMESALLLLDQTHRPVTALPPSGLEEAGLTRHNGSGLVYFCRLGLELLIGVPIEFISYVNNLSCYNCSREKVAIAM